MVSPSERKEAGYILRKFVGYISSKFRTRLNRVVVFCWLVFLAALTVLFLLPAPKRAAEIALVMAMVESLIIAVLLVIRAKKSKGRLRLAWIVVALYLIGAIFLNSLKVLLNPGQLASPVAVVSSGLFLVGAVVMFAWDFIVEFSRKRTVLDALWVGATVSSAGYFVAFKPFFDLETTNLQDSLSFATLPIVAVVSASVIFSVVYQSRSFSFGLVLVSVSVFLTCAIATYAVWLAANGVPHSYLEGVDYLWHLSFVLFGIASQASLEVKQTSIARNRNNHIPFLTVLPILLGTPIVFVSAPDDFRSFIAGSALLLALQGARLVAVFEENSELNKRLKSIAHRDYLTGIPNRRALEEYISATLERQSIAVLFIDLDHFKEINDLFGHDAGDHVLKDISDKISKSLRQDDYFARFGGDEFVVVIAGEGEQNALDPLVDRIQKITKTSYIFEQSTAYLDATIGVQMAQKGDDPKSVVYKADSLMLEGKKLSKGKVYVQSE